MKKNNLAWFGSKMVIFLAAFAQGVQYADAFRLVHADLGIWGSAGGVTAGAGIVLSVAYVSNRIPGLASKRARQGAWWALGVLMTLSPLLLTFSNFYTMSAAFRERIAAAAWIVSAVAAILPEAALVGAAFADRSLGASQNVSGATESATESMSSATHATKVHRGRVSGATRMRKPVTDDVLLAIWQETPGASDNQVAQRLGISRQAVQRRRVNLQARGLFGSNVAVSTETEKQ